MNFDTKQLNSFVTGNGTSNAVTTVINQANETEYDVTVSIGNVTTVTGATQFATIAFASSPYFAGTFTALSLVGQGTTAIPLLANMANSVLKFRINGTEANFKGDFVKCTITGEATAHTALVSVIASRKAVGEFNRPQ